MFHYGLPDAFTLVFREQHHIIDRGLIYAVTERACESNKGFAIIRVNNGITRGKGLLKIIRIAPSASERCSFENRSDRIPINISRE